MTSQRITAIEDRFNILKKRDANKQEALNAIKKNPTDEKAEAYLLHLSFLSKLEEALEKCKTDNVKHKQSWWKPYPETEFQLNEQERSLESFVITIKNFPPSNIILTDESPVNLSKYIEWVNDKIKFSFKTNGDLAAKEAVITAFNEAQIQRKKT